MSRPDNHCPVADWHPPAAKPQAEARHQSPSPRSAPINSGQPQGSGGHQRYRGAPRAVLRGAADGADAHVIDRARREVRQDDVFGVRKDARLQPRPRARGILQLIRLRIGHRRQPDGQLRGDGIIQGEHRLVQRHRGGVGIDNVKAGSQHLRQRQGRRQALDIRRPLAHGRNQGIPGLGFQGRVELAALGRRRDGILEGCLQRRKDCHGHREIGKQQVVFEAHHQQDCETVHVTVIVGREFERDPNHLFHITPLFSLSENDPPDEFARKITHTFKKSMACASL